MTDTKSDIVVSALAMLALGAILLVVGGWCAIGVGGMMQGGFISIWGLFLLGCGTIVGIGGGGWLIFSGIKALVRVPFHKNED